MPYLQCLRFNIRSQFWLLPQIRSRLWKNNSIVSRSSHSEVFCKKGVLEDVTKFTRKHLCQRPGTLLKKRLWHRCFPVNFVTFLRTPFFVEHPWWLLLYQQGYLMQTSSKRLEIYEKYSGKRRTNYVALTHALWKPLIQN